MAPVTPKLAIAWQAIQFVLTAQDAVHQTVYHTVVAAMFRVVHSCWPRLPDFLLGWPLIVSDSKSTVSVSPSSVVGFLPASMTVCLGE